MGRVFVAGGNEKMRGAFTSIAASYLAVGSSVYLNENGIPVEYLVVNQGIPCDSTSYDSSCRGIWLLRKDIALTHAWHSEAQFTSTADIPTYATSTIHEYLQTEFLNRFDEATQSAIRTMYDSSELVNGAKVFLLSAMEVSSYQEEYDYLGTPYQFNTSDDTSPVSYFEDVQDGRDTTKRIAYLDGVATNWWLRTNSYVASSSSYWAFKGDYIASDGGFYNAGATSAFGIRPALILPSTSIFNKDTLVFEGVQ